MASYSSKFANFDLPRLHLAPRVGGDRVRISQRPLASENYSRVPRLPHGVICVFLCIAISVDLRLVADTDRQTDGPTQGHIALA